MFPSHPFISFILHLENQISILRKEPGSSQACRRRCPSPQRSHARQKTQHPELAQGNSEKTATRGLNGSHVGTLGQSLHGPLDRQSTNHWMGSRENIQEPSIYIYYRFDAKNHGVYIPLNILNQSMC